MPIPVYFICASVVLLPFNGLPYLHGLFHEMAGEAAFYPMTAGLILYLSGAALKKESGFELPRDKGFALLLLFILSIFVSTALNFTEISRAAFKGRSGLSKNLLQTLLFIYMSLIPVLIYNAFGDSRGRMAKLVGASVLASFLIAGSYSFLEIIHLSGFSEAIKYVSPFVQDASSISNFRLRSVSGEPSYLGLYGAFAFPFLLKCLFEAEAIKKPLFFLLNAYFLFIMLMTYSRTSYIIIGFELLFFILLACAFSHRAARERNLKTSLLLILIVLCEFYALSFSGRGYNPQETISSVKGALGNKSSSVTVEASESEFSASNSIRFLSIKKGLELALDNPLAGVGLGQYGFYFPALFKAEKADNEEAQLVLNELSDDAHGTKWPPAYSLYSRVAAELGFPALIIWLSVWGASFIGVFRAAFAGDREEGGMDLFGAALVVSVSGVMLGGFTNDSFRFFGYWILLGLCLVYTRGRKA